MPSGEVARHDVRTGPRRTAARRCRCRRRGRAPARAGRASTAGRDLLAPQPGLAQGQHVVGEVVLAPPRRRTSRRLRAAACPGMLGSPGHCPPCRRARPPRTGHAPARRGGGLSGGGRSAAGRGSARTRQPRVRRRRPAKSAAAAGAPGERGTRAARLRAGRSAPRPCGPRAGKGPVSAVVPAASRRCSPRRALAPQRRVGHAEGGERLAGDRPLPSSSASRGSGW